MNDNLSKENVNVKTLVHELVLRLEDRTGFRFEACVPAPVTGGHAPYPKVNLPNGGNLTVKWGEEGVEVSCASPELVGTAGLEPLHLRLLQALTEEIWADIVKGYAATQPEFTSPWERLLNQAIQGQWEPERFANEAAIHGLGTLPSGIPVLVQPLKWTPEITDIMQGLFPDAPVRLALTPDIFLYVPWDRDELGSAPHKTRAETLVNEIHSLLADEVGVKATVLVGESKEPNLLQSFRTVKKLADIQRRFFASSPGLTVWQAGLATLMWEIPPHAGEKFVDLILSRLSKELLDTLAAYLAKDMNLADAARVLFIHRNTLIYRLDRIEELTGYNPRRLDEAINLFIALWFKQHRYLK